jgi:hypothetical protein
MKWGRKKGKKSTGKGPIKGAKTSTDHPDHTTKLELKKKKLSSMSNAEIKMLNERLQLERQYKDLTKKDVSAGRRFITDLLTNTAKQTASTYASKYAIEGVEEAINRAEKRTKA